MPTITIDDTMSPYSLTLADDVVLVDSTNGSVTLVLPSVHPIGKRYFIKDKFGTTDLQPILIVATPKLIDNQPNFTLTVEKQAVLAHSDGTNWYIL